MRIAIRAAQTFELFKIESEYAQKMVEDNDDDVDKDGLDAKTATRDA